MKLKVLNSGSAGNSYLLTAKSGERLLIELGVEWKKIQDALNYDYSRVVAIVSHSHMDHAKSLKRASLAGISIAASTETFDSCGVIRELGSIFLEGDPISANNFIVRTFDLKHDVKTFGFLIWHKECGNICFITDTNEINNSFPGINHFMVEANFCEEVLFENAMNSENGTFLSERVANSHFSLQKCKEFLSENDLSQCENIILLHLSDRNADEKLFKKEITAMTGINCEVARPGLEIDLSLNMWEL